MLADSSTLRFPPRLWGALVATLVAFAVALVVSLNLYFLEDGNPLTSAAYSASPLLRFSYDGVYLSALVAGVAVCGMLGYALARSDAPVLLGLGVVALLVILGGFGGLLVRQPVSFLVLVLAFVLLAVGSFLAGRALAARTRPALGARSAALLGACISTGLALLVNGVALVAHTLALNPVSHALYMQGQLGASHFNGLLIGMALEVLALCICLLSLALALRSRA